jgi:hypothetical protein
VRIAADFPLGMAPARFVEPLEQPCESIHLRIPVFSMRGSIRLAGGLGL